MNRADTERMTVFVGGLGAIATGLAFALEGWVTGFSTAVGAVMAMANWYLLRWIVGKVVSGTVKSQASFMFVLFLKLGAMMAAVYLVISSGVVAPVPFLVGISCLMAGLLLGSFLYILSGPTVQSER